MKATRIIILAFALLLGLGNAIAQEDSSKAQKTTQKNEVVLTKSTRTRSGYNNYQAAYKAALREAKQANPNKEVGIRNLKEGEVKVNGDGSVSHYYTYTVVELPGVVAQNLFEAINQATREIDEGNRFALDKLTITDGQTDKEKTKGQIVDYLLGKGYKVVAKEHLEKLYKEQQGQQSGIYNPDTTVEGNNFTAVGYFISARITEEYIQVQVVNVSTGEYEGNVTVNL
ncbi:MAG: hypothetical protein IKH44_02245 [Bacteroidales bacterium]|nr:hypothetical protein [Bacteroidales bacterium]